MGSNLYPLGVPDIVIQRILRHASVSTTLTYYIKTAADDLRKAMMTLENGVTEAGQMQSDTARTLEGKSLADPSSVH
ncbi:MAG TPA: hypothetical protein VNO32_11065 [Candidatus Acidoferrum sp.]|nr:hypothetical protein [Candidatus Acidoferrum sp.]